MLEKMTGHHRTENVYISCNLSLSSGAITKQLHKNILLRIRHFIARTVGRKPHILFHSQAGEAHLNYTHWYKNCRFSDKFGVYQIIREVLNLSTVSKK
jgi:hypothetical protein